MRNLAKLLDQTEREIKRTITKLEDLNGYPSHDVRLLAQNTQAVRQKLKDLGLDPDDTRAEEFYQALRSRYARDSTLFDKALGISTGHNANQRVDQAVKLVKAVVQAQEVWVLKNPAAKKVLRSMPPKRVMKQLNYRSTESMLKHEKVEEILLAAPHLESSAWQMNFQKSVNKLAPSDYELRPPEVMAISSKQWQGIKTKPISVDRLTGVIGLWPSAAINRAPVLTLSLMLLDGIEKLVGMQAAGSISELNPALLWWEKAKSLIADCGEATLSLNYKDVAMDHLKNTAFAARGLDNGRRSLWDDLINRYENQIATISDSVNTIEEKAQKKVDEISTQPNRNLAVEYAEAIANEF